MPRMLIGHRMVPDVSNPQPEDVDVDFMRMRLAMIRRFSGHPQALFVSQHQRLCGAIARTLGFHARVIEWAEHHDDHEFVMGDIPTPVQRVIGRAAIRSLQTRWDDAICGALGISAPSEEVRRQVETVDAAALVMEWHALLGRDPDELGVVAPVVLFALRNEDLVHMARA